LPAIDAALEHRQFAKEEHETSYRARKPLRRSSVCRDRTEQRKGDGESFSGDAPVATASVALPRRPCLRAARELSRRRTGELTSLMAVERCAEPGVIAAYRKADYPYMDLIRFAEAARLAGAEKVDKGEISESEYDHQRRVLRDRLADEIDRRNAEAPPPRSTAEMPDPSVTAKLIAGLSAFSALGP